MAPSANQASAPSVSKAVTMRWRNSSDRVEIGPGMISPVSLLTKTAIGTPQARWRREHPVGALGDHRAQALLPGGRHEARLVDGGEGAGAQGVRAVPADRCAWLPDRRRTVHAAEVLVHMDEPLRRVAEDDRLLGAPGMRILVLQPAAREQLVGIDQRRDDALVGVALVALVVDDAGRAALGIGTEARRVLGVDSRHRRPGTGSSVSMPLLGDLGGLVHPDLEVVGAVARRGVDEPGAGIVGDVLAVEQRHGELVAAAEALERVGAGDADEFVGSDIAKALEGQLGLVRRCPRRACRRRSAFRPAAARNRSRPP